MALMEIGMILALTLQTAETPQPTLAQKIEAAQAADGAASEANEPPTIVVQAEDDTKKKQVIVGSRIPQKPWLKPGGVATNTGTPGFTPGSGMDPDGGHRRTITTRECKSDFRGLSTNACRALASGDAALANGEVEDALFWFRQVSNWQSEFTPIERLIGAQRIFALGRDTDNADLRLEALTDMLHTGELQPSEQLAAARSAAAIAMKKDEDHFASLMLREVIKLEPTDAQSIANLAILQRKAGDTQAGKTMLQAISVREAAGRSVPKGWRDFAAFKAE